jgi:predicted RNA-binding protein YlxR (DUF448 family)
VLEALGLGVVELAQLPTDPVRTCIGCRKSQPRSQLLRVVQDLGRVTADSHARKKGRGAWLHVECFDEAVRRKAFNRALKFDGNLELSPLREFLSHGGERR